MKNNLFDPNLDEFNTKNLNNKPKYIILGILSVLFVMLMIVVLTAGSKNSEDKTTSGLKVGKKENSDNNEDFIKNMAKQRKLQDEEADDDEAENYLAKLSNEEQPTSSRDEVPVALETVEETTRIGFYPSSPIPISMFDDNYTVFDRDDTYSSVHLTSSEITAFRQKRLSEIEEALKSPINAHKGDLQVSKTSATEISRTPQMEKLDYDEELKKAYAVAGITQPASTVASASVPTADGGSSGDKWTLNSQLDKPSPYTIKTGAVIPATLITEINSTLDGQIIGQVRNHVYDTATGKHLLIPQGTRMVGNYGSNVQYGQSRLYIAWNRLIFPNGSSLDIESMPGADMAGRGGFEDKVNHHYLRIFGNALLLSLIIAGVNVSQENLLGDYVPYYLEGSSRALSQSLGQTLGETMSQIIRKNLNIAPEIMIRPGYLFNIMVVKDITLPNYR